MIRRDRRDGRAAMVAVVLLWAPCLVWSSTATAATSLAVEEVAWGVYRVAGTDVRLPTADLEPLREIVGSARLVGLGESIHTSGGFYRMKERVFRYLVEELGFRVFAFESPWEEAERIDEYVQTCEGTAEQAIVGNTFPVWAGEALRDLVQWMCEWNQSHGSDRVHLFGFDVQQPSRDRDALQRFFQELGFADTDPPLVDILQCPTRLDRAGRLNRDQAERCVAGLDFIAAYLDRNETDIVARTSQAALAEARIRELGLRSFILQWTLPFPGNSEARDRAMAEVFEYHRNRRFPNARTVLWAHNGHLARDGRAVQGFLDMGELLHRRHGRDYRPIALFAWDIALDWPRVHCGRHYLTFEEGDLEWDLHQTGEDYLLVDLGALAVDHPILPGCTAREFGNVGPGIVADHFDAALFLDVSPAMVPLGRSCRGSSAVTPLARVGAGVEEVDVEGLEVRRVRGVGATGCERPRIERLSASSSGARSVELTWRLPVETDRLELERSSGPGSPVETVVLAGTATSYLDEAVAPDTRYRYRLLGFNRYGPSDPVEVDAATSALDTSPCVAGEGTLCLGDGRFEITVDWQSPSDEGSGRVAVAAGGSGVLWFFTPDNWEMLVKVVDGCAVNQRFWVLATAITDVGYQLRVRDTSTGRVASYDNALGQPGRALIDVEAFEGCAQGGGSVRTSAAPARGAAECEEGAGALCLGGGRFRVEVEWRDFEGNQGSGAPAPAADERSGLFWFFAPDNWEMLVKVLDGCALNGSYWVYFGATTNVGFTLRVTDLSTGEVATYGNDLGNPADTVADTTALPCSI